MNRVLERAIGERVQELRHQQALTQSEFVRALRAEGLNWYVTTVSAVENGRRPMRFSEAVIVCRTFDAELNQLAP